MPLPRYQPVRKKPKILGPSLDELDDYCLSKIIGYALLLSSQRDDESLVRDNGRTERNLSLVSKRWYFITQTQIGLYGVHRINLDQVSRGRNGSPKRKPASTGIAFAPNLQPTARRPGVLMQKNTGYGSLVSHHHHQPPRTQSSNSTTSYNVSLFRAIQPKLLKYKNILIEGTLSSDEFNRLVVALNAARTEQLNLKIKIEKDRTQAREVTTLPRQMCFLEKLTLSWPSGSKNAYSNSQTWTIYDRAVRLRALEIHLNEEEDESKGLQNAEVDITGRAFSNRFSGSRLCDFLHPHLEKIVFNRSSTDSPINCSYTSLVRGILMREDSVAQVDTNDNMLIENLIRSSDRICTTHELRFLKFLSPIRNMDLLSQLLRSRSLGKDYLSIVVENVDQLEEVRMSMETFKLVRHNSAICQLHLHLRDQKFSDCEDKVKNLVYLSRLAEVIIHMSAQQRISIDCCHLMWSIGRALQSSEPQGKCLFKITLQFNSNLTKSSTSNSSEITVPFGKCHQYKINPQKEDLNRHREIMKSLKRDCYHQFVKSVRDNMTSS